MANATAAINRTWRDSKSLLTRTGVYADQNLALYQGTFVGLNAQGEVINGVATAIRGLGFVYQDVAAAATPTQSVTVDFNMEVDLYIPDADPTCIGATVYATDNQTFTISGAGPNTCLVGQIVQPVNLTDKIFTVFVTCKA